MALRKRLRSIAKSQALRSPVRRRRRQRAIARSRVSWTRSSAASASRSNAQAYRRRAGMCGSRRTAISSMIIIVHHQADEGSLRLGDVPDVIDAVARHVARLGVFGPGVERLALVGPLLRAVIARHGPPVGRPFGAGRGPPRGAA